MVFLTVRVLVTVVVFVTMVVFPLSHFKSKGRLNFVQISEESNEQAGAELGQAQVMLDNILVVVVEVLVKTMVEVQLLFRVDGWVVR